MKIVFTDSKTVASSGADLDTFRQFGELVLYDLTSPEELPDRIKDADMVLCNKTIFDANALSQAPKLKYIGLCATGYNNIDIAYATQHGITVCNAGSYSTDAGAQHTFALRLSLFNKVREYDDFVQKGGWIETEMFSPMVFRTHELSGKTIGIVGYGNIGKATAKIAHAFGMNVVVFTRTVLADENVNFVDFDTLLSLSDIVTVHCPLNSESQKMFCSDTFKKFKKGSYFINTARGGLVDENALKEALENDQLAGAAVDTITIEPMSHDCVLLGVKNLIITPHIAWSPKETTDRLIKIVSDNIKSFLDGNPKNKVN